MFRTTNLEALQFFILSGWYPVKNYQKKLPYQETESSKKKKKKRIAADALEMKIPELSDMGFEISN